MIMNNKNNMSYLWVIYALIYSVCNNRTHHKRDSAGDCCA